MKKAALFFTGVIMGVLGTLLVLYLYSVDNQPYDDGLYGLSIFPEKGECIPTSGELEVLQVVKPNMALAYTDKHIERQIVVLLIKYDGKSYYDDQKIKVPSGQCARQIGTYQYTTNMDFEKTVPAVVIE